MTAVVYLLIFGACVVHIVLRKKPVVGRAAESAEPLVPVVGLELERLRSRPLVRVSPTPTELRAFFVENHLTEPARSRQHCTRAVLALGELEDYVLALVTLERIGREPVEYALIGRGEAYFDPIGDPKAVDRAADYRLEATLTAQDLVQLIGARFDAEHVQDVAQGRSVPPTIAVGRDGAVFLPG